MTACRLVFRYVRYEKTYFFVVWVVLDNEATGHCFSLYCTCSHCYSEYINVLLPKQYKIDLMYSYKQKYQNIEVARYQK